MTIKPSYVSLQPQTAKQLWPFTTWVVCVNFLLLAFLACADPADYQGLMTFMNAVDDGHILAKSWHIGKDPCNSSWIGVQCFKGRVWSLILESQQLKGSIPVDSLYMLDKLRRLSLNDNALTGPVPELSSPYLRAIWLQNNAFEGPIFDIFSATPRLNVLDLSNNRLNGSIPNSLALLENLRELSLQNNSLSGQIPPLNQTTLKKFNVSNNQLVGEVPFTHAMQQTFNASSFLHNPMLCGIPLDVTCMMAHKKLLVVKKVAFIVVAGTCAVLMLLGLVFFWHYRLKSRAVILTEGEGKTKSKDLEERQTKSTTEDGRKQEDLPIKDIPSTPSESPKEFEAKSEIVVVSGELRPQEAFKLQDLLVASAKVLGKGALGSSYMATLEHRALAVVVKRLGRSLNGCAKKEFEQQAQLLGGLYHPNLVPLLAYYFSKDEKLFVYQYMPNQSLYTLLHGKPGIGGAILDWTARLKIARDVARGLAHLHKKCKSQKLPHGNIKSSNILFDKGLAARLTDYGLAPLLHPKLLTNPHLIVACTAPEYVSSHKLTSKTDVFCYGVLVLELLTGKLPSYYGSGYGGHGNNAEKDPPVHDLPAFVRGAAMTRSETEVFDEVLLTTPADREGMMGLLKLAMECVAESPEERPKMKQVYKEIQQIKDAPPDSFPLESSEDVTLSGMSATSTEHRSIGALRRFDS